MQGERSFTPATAGLMLMLMLLLPLLGLVLPPAFGAESGFEIIPKWVRPGRSVTIKLGPEVNTATTMFLRLSGRTAVRDFPLNSDQIHRRVIEVRIPAAMNAGKYETSLVDQDGRDLGITGPD